MGNAVSDLIRTVNEADEKQSIAKEQLQMLMKLADARLDTFEEKLKRMFLDKDCKRALYHLRQFSWCALSRRKVEHTWKARSPL